MFAGRETILDRNERHDTDGADLSAQAATVAAVGIHNGHPTVRQGQRLIGAVSARFDAFAAVQAVAAINLCPHRLPAQLGMGANQGQYDPGQVVDIAEIFAFQISGQTTAQRLDDLTALKHRRQPRLRQLPVFATPPALREP